MVKIIAPPPAWLTGQRPGDICGVSHAQAASLVKAGVASRDLDAAVLVDLPPTERLPAHVHLVAGPVCVRMLKYVDRFEPGTASRSSPSEFYGRQGSSRTRLRHSRTRSTRCSPTTVSPSPICRSDVDRPRCGGGLSAGRRRAEDPAGPEGRAAVRLSYPEIPDNWSSRMRGSAHFWAYPLDGGPPLGIFISPRFRGEINSRVCGSAPPTSLAFRHGAPISRAARLIPSDRVLPWNTTKQQGNNGRIRVACSW